jgi:5'-phosphate synthase pdxT subunit
MAGKKRVGVLALQGDFQAHQRALDTGRARKPWKCAPRPALEGLQGLVIPGGESTTMMKLLEQEKLLDPLREFGRERPIFRNLRGRDPAGHRCRQPAAGFARADGYGGGAQCLWAPARQPHCAHLT